MNHEHAGGDHATIPYRTYVNVWLALVGLTLVTVGAAYTDLRHLAIFTALLIASTKCMLVILYFMHIRFETRLFTYMLIAIFATYVIFVILTFADYSFR
jgi:cytochrome c oxidase subunit 4